MRKIRKEKKELRKQLLFYLKLQTFIFEINSFLALLK